MLATYCSPFTIIADTAITIVFQECATLFANDQYGPGNVGQRDAYPTSQVLSLAMQRPSDRTGWLGGKHWLAAAEATWACADKTLW